MMSLSDWQKAGWLVAHKADRAEIRDLLSLADRDIRECQADEHTIGADIEMISTLDAFRKKRNISDYERSGCVSVTKAREMFALARVLKNTVREWIREKHPHLAEEKFDR